MIPLSLPQKRLVDWLTDFFAKFGYAPTYQEIASGLGYSSKDPVNSLIKTLVKKGILSHQPGKARTLRFTTEWVQMHPLWPAHQGFGKYLPILGTIAAHSLVENCADALIEYRYVCLPKSPGSDQHYILRVWGDSMIDAAILHDDLIVMRSVSEPDRVKEGQIVAARVGSQTTLKYLHRNNNQIILKPANATYTETIVNADEVEIQGVFSSLLRGELWGESLNY